MATGAVILPAHAAVLPDNSASNLAAQLRVIKGTGSAPVSFWAQMHFPDASTTGAIWQFELPPDANGTPAPNVKLKWKANDTTTNAVRWSVQVAAFAAATVVNSRSFAAANLQTASNAGSTAYKMNETAITLSNADSMAAGNTIFLLVQRIGADGADTLTVDAELVLIEFTYTI
jgi:hypothetical protein